MCSSDLDKQTNRSAEAGCDSQMHELKAGKTCYRHIETGKTCYKKSKHAVITQANPSINIQCFRANLSSVPPSIVPAVPVLQIVPVGSQPTRHQRLTWVPSPTRAALNKRISIPRCPASTNTTLYPKMPRIGYHYSRCPAPAITILYPLTNPNHIS